MANGEVESIASTFDSEIYLDENYDRLLDAFNEMHEKAQKLSQAYNSLKGKLRWHVDKIISCQKELSSLKLKDEELEKALENSSCNDKTISTSSPSQCEMCKEPKSKNEYLLKTLSKFTMGRDNLDAFLSQQKCKFKKEGLGYTFGKKTFITLRG